MGTITATGAGGTPPYQYSINGVDYQAAGSFTSLNGGTYTVWVKDANGCTITKVVSITDNGSDLYESNNSKNQSKVISIGTAINARIALVTDVADWFKFTTPAGVGNFRLYFNHPSVSYVFNMYATGNNTPALVPVSTTPISKDYVLAGSTTYYISITGGLSFTCYQLSVNPVVASRTGNGNLYTEKSKPALHVTDILIARVYPNPHLGNFTLQIESPEDGMATIELFNSIGQIVIERKSAVTKGKGNSIQFNNVREAILHYRVKIDRQIVNGKIIGQH